MSWVFVKLPFVAFNNMSGFELTKTHFLKLRHSIPQSKGLEQPWGGG